MSALHAVPSVVSALHAVPRSLSLSSPVRPHGAPKPAPHRGHTPPSPHLYLSYSALAPAHAAGGPGIRRSVHAGSGPVHRLLAGHEMGARAAPVLACSLGSPSNGAGLCMQPSGDCPARCLLTRVVDILQGSFRRHVDDEQDLRGGSMPDGWPPHAGRAPLLLNEAWKPNTHMLSPRWSACGAGRGCSARAQHAPPCCAPAKRTMALGFPPGWAQPRELLPTSPAHGTG